MWFIKNDLGEIIYLKPNKVMTVSRKSGYDIVLENDASISKLHASITVKPKPDFKNNEPSSTVVVQDQGSKYGTFVIDCNNLQQKLGANVHVLTATDKIKFGVKPDGRIFTLHYVPLIVSTSRLNVDEKLELQNIIDAVDGVIVDKLEEYCTHLTVSNVKLTAQLVLALACGTQIVSLNYWHAVKQCVENNNTLPDTTNFIPSINEGSIDKDYVSLKVNPDRKVLFKNLTFVCFSASQYECLKEVIRYAGGKLLLFKEGSLNLNQLCSKNFIILQLTTNVTLPSQTSTNSYDSIENALQKVERRLVPESEISLAILYCSTETNCNPKFNFRRVINMPRETRNVQLSSTVLAPDTEDMLTDSQCDAPVIINETLTSSEQMEEPLNSKKRKLLVNQEAIAETVKDLSQLAVENKRVAHKSTFGFREPSARRATIIDETIPSFESDSIEPPVKRQNLVSEKITTPTLTGARHFNFQTNVQTLTTSEKENVHTSKAHVSLFSKNVYPSTSKDTSWKKARDFEQNDGSNEKPKFIEQTCRERSPYDNIMNKTCDSKTIKTSSSDSVTVGRKPKRNYIIDEDDMFSFVNEGARQKRNISNADGDDLFELVEDPNVKKNLHQEENMFDKVLIQMKKGENKRRRSVSSNDSSAEEEPLQIKVESSTSIGSVDQGPLIRCKKERDLMHETCKSTIEPLLRKDIDLTLDNSAVNLKTFIKVYTAIPKQRIKLKNMYVWKSEDQVVDPGPREAESTSSEEEDDDFRFHSNKPTKKVVYGRK